jgi:hypothetical protein
VIFENLILKAKRLLRLGAQADTHPQQSIARLQEAWRKADDYKKSHALTGQEQAIFDMAVLANVSKPYSPSDDYFEDALAKLQEFRTQQAELLARPVKSVTIVSEDRWQPEWRQERRLGVLFEPRIRGGDTDFGPAIEEVLSSRWPNRVELVSQASDFAADANERPWSALFRVVIYRRGALAQWKGSAFNVRESNRAMELKGGAFTTHTTVDATIHLASMAYDHLTERLEAAGREKPETDRLLLACGFAAGNIAIPRGRPIKFDEKISDPVVIDQETPRTWFEIVRVAETEPREGPVRMTSLERWMAIEQ